MSLASGTRIGSYEIIAAIGAGGMGEVYRARDPKLHRDVAIKVLPKLFAGDRDRLIRFEREAQSLAALNHPSIAQVFAVIEEPPALAMELVEGEDLSQRIARGPIPFDEALPIARQIAEALEAAHERGIVHRDLKPANIKVREDGTVKVLDFGLAKIADASTPEPLVGAAPALNSPTFTSPAMTAMGVILGTAAYMAPEQARGKSVDRRADIWAFGVVLYEMLTGVRPFAGETMTDALSAIVSREPDWNAVPAATRTAVGPLLRRCLEKDPRRRLQAIGEARIALEAPLPSTQAEAIDRAGIRMPIVAALIVAALGVGAVATWTLSRGPQPPSPARPARLLLSISPAETLIGGFALSPDGSRLAFVGQLGGNNKLFVRRMDHDQATAVAGTDGVSIVGPSFSPDGRWLVFTATGALKKVSVDGGPVTILGRGISGANSRAAWGADGTIVFSNPMRGLSMIPAEGGQPEVLTIPDPKSAELTHEMPWLLPDGKTLLFSVRHGNTTTARIDALALGTRSRRPLFPGMVLGLVGDDQLIVGREDSVVSVPFDTVQLAVRGDPAPLLDGTLRAARVVFTVFPLFTVARNGTIVFVPARSADASRHLLAVDRSGAATPIAGPVHEYSDPRVSPGGEKIVVHVFEEGRENWTLDLRSGAFTRLTFDAGEDETPVWSPDGKWVFWTATRGQINRAIFQKASDGSGAERMVWSGDPHIHIGGVSPDGSTLVISVIEGEHVHLASVRVADGKLTPLLTTPFSNQTPTLSPDGRWLAYASDESGQAEVYVQPFPSMQGRTQVSAEGGSEPVWARNGRELYYRGKGKIMAVSVTTGDRFICGAPRALFDDRIANPQGAGHTGYDVTPDGRFVIVAGAANSAPLTHLQVVYRPSQPWP